MSLVELPRDDAGNVQMQTDKEIAEWIKHNSIVNGAVTKEQAEHVDWIAFVRCSVCSERLGNHTLFGRQLSGPNIGKAWHNACGYDAKPSDGN